MPGSSSRFTSRVGRLEGAFFSSLPLACRATVLERFVERLLNIAPPTVAAFEPAGPWVHLMLFMAAPGTSPRPSPIALGFAVPLRVSQGPTDGPRRLSYGYALPYLFVSDPLDMLDYRQRFGWGTQVGRIFELSPLGDWVLETDDYDSLMRGNPPSTSRLLSIHIAPTEAGPPPGSTAGPVRPEGAAGPLEAGIGHSMNVYSLCQFRDAEAVDRACYQGLTAVRVDLGVTRQVTAHSGIEIRLLHPAGPPIVDNLGLIAADGTPTESASGQGAIQLALAAQRSIEGRFSIGAARLLAQRGPTPRWQTPRAPLAQAQAPSISARDIATNAPLPWYETVSGSFFSRLERPPLLKNFTWFMVPLPACPRTVASYCASPPFKLPGQPHRLRPLPDNDRIYLLVESYSKATFQGSPSVPLPFRVVDLILPVAWCYQGEPLGTALLVPFLFSDSAITVALNRWQSGFPGTWSEIRTSPRTPQGAGARSRLEVTPPFLPHPLLEMSIPTAAHGARFDAGETPPDPLRHLVSQPEPLSFLVHKAVGGIDVPPRSPAYEALVCQRVQLHEQRIHPFDFAVDLKIRDAPGFTISHFLAPETRVRNRDAHGAWNFRIGGEHCTLFTASQTLEEGFNLLCRFTDTPWHAPKSAIRRPWMNERP